MFQYYLHNLLFHMTLLCFCFYLSTVRGQFVGRDGYGGAFLGHHGDGAAHGL